MIARESLERHQVWCYLVGAGAGLAVGLVAPGAGERAEPLVWPVIALLLFATFTQIPATALASAVRDRRFLVTSLIANFVVMPPIVWGLVSLTPDDPALRIGLLLVLLAPCTDWFISFTQLGGGDASRATASSPVLLIAQLLLLPLYLAAFTGGDTTAVFTLSDLCRRCSSSVFLSSWLSRSPGLSSRRLGVAGCGIDAAGGPCRCSRW